MADDESESKPKVLVLGDKYIQSWLNKQDGLSFVYSNSSSDFKDCQRILFYPPQTFSEGCSLEKTSDLFEKDVSRLGGIEGVVLYIWVDESDWGFEVEMVKRLRLEERGCVWGFGAGSDEQFAPRMDKFFNDNSQTNLKPAKREK